MENLKSLAAPMAKALAVIKDGWSISPMFKAQSAPVVQVLYYREYLLGGNAQYAYLRPDAVPGVPMWLYGSQYPGGKALNRAAFLAPEEIRQGNTSRNNGRGLPVWQADVSVQRQFPIRNG
jgi:hypothetical protein